MTFLDDSMAVRERITLVRKELEELDEQRRSTAQERASLGSIDDEVRSAPRPPIVRFALAPFAVVLLMVLIKTVSRLDWESDARIFYGEVDAASGAAPVEIGAPCSVFVDEGGDDWDAKVQVLCGGRAIYAQSSKQGYLDCPEEEGFMRCLDEGDSESSGDPRLLLDRRRGQVIVEDRGWSVGVSIPRALGEPQ